MHIEYRSPLPVRGSLSSAPHPGTARVQTFAKAGLLAVAGVLSVLFVGCSKNQGEQQAPPPAEVNVLTVNPETVPLTRELVGRLSPVRVADVRARVAGVLQKRLYKEGSEVKEGQPLFQIDAAPLKASLDAALAQLAQAEATATNAAVTAKRNRQLAPDGIVSKSALDDAEAAERSARAAQQQAQANAQTARINLGYATVRAPISGRSGQQQVTEGALVGEGEATLLTTVEQIDSLYVNFDQPATELQQLRQAQTKGDVTLLEGDKAQLQVFMNDGTPYPHPGLLDFSGITVNSATSALSLRGSLPNPDRLLLPGLFVNVKLVMGQRHNAFRIPQAAVQRETKGPFVLIVGAEDKVEQRFIQTEMAIDTDWIVTGGLKAGDRVIVQGLQKAAPGSVVKPVPYRKPEQPAQEGVQAAPTRDEESRQKQEAASAPAPTE